MSEPQWVTAKELAEILNIPVTWIYQRTRLGSDMIPHVRMGKYVRFNIDEVVIFSKSGHKKSPWILSNSMAPLTPL